MWYYKVTFDISAPRSLTPLMTGNCPHTTTTTTTTTITTTPLRPQPRVFDIREYVKKNGAVFKVSNQTR